MQTNDQNFLNWCVENRDALVALKQTEAFKTQGTHISLHFDDKQIMQEIVKGEQRLWRKRSENTK